MASLLHVFGWWLLIQALALAALPLCLVTLRALPDRGYGVSKAFGLLAFAYPAWLLITLGFFENRRPWLLAAAALVAALAWGVIWRPLADELRAFLRRHRALLVWEEGVLLAAFLGFLAVRSLNPEIKDTEKFMDFAFLNGVTRSLHFPPIDPWFAGHTVNYYHFGYLMQGLLTVLSGVPSAEAFNLALGALFALTACGVFALGYNVVEGLGAETRPSHGPWSWHEHRGPLAGGLIACFLVLIAGNLYGPLRLLADPSYLGKGFWDGMGWAATRVLVIKQGQQDLDYTINEFPIFSFLLGDLHPHVLALPFAVLALTLAYAWLREPLSWPLPLRRPTVVPFLAGAVSLGSLYFLNSWDLPTYFGLAAAAIWLGSGRLPRAAGTAGLLALCAVALYLPFYLTFRPPIEGQGGLPLGLVPIHSRLDQFLEFWGAQLVPPLALLVLMVLRQGGLRRALGGATGLLRPPPVGIVAPVGKPARVIPRSGPSGGSVSGGRRAPESSATRGRSAWDVRLSVLLLAGIAAVAAARGLAVLVFATAIAAVAAAALWRERGDRGLQFALGLVAAAGLLLAVCEVVYIRDFYGGALRRMNTVFKFYFQAWLLLGIGGAVSVIAVARAVRGRTGATLVFAGVTALLGGAGLIYPLHTSWHRTEHVGKPGAATVWQWLTAGSLEKRPTLDGMAWMRRFHPEDWEAVQWLRRETAHRRESPVVLEAWGPAYSELARVSTQVGVPTVLGWEQHERLWRGNQAWAEIESRKRDVDAIYGSLRLSDVQPLLEKYRIAYIFIGYAERQRYPPEALAKFDTTVPAAFRQGDTAIYQVGAR